MNVAQGKVILDVCFFLRVKVMILILAQGSLFILRSLLKRFVTQPDNLPTFFFFRKEGNSIKKSMFIILLKGTYYSF